MFTVIGERINMTRKSIRTKVWDRDEDFIRNEAARQVRAGASHIDINAGGDPAKEVDDMTWLTTVVSDEVDVPLSFDSANPEAIKAGIAICNRPGTIINSITMENERVQGILPVVKEYNTGIVCLTMNDEGMPEDYEGRVKITDDIATLLTGHNISLDRAYFDHLVRPASTNPGQARFILDAVSYTKKTYPDAHIALGLSNISFGIPKRNNFNKAFFAMLVAAGCDGAIIDPTEPDMITTLHAARAVMGYDEYCMEYLTKMREDGLA
ncbi:MAG: dihydropteroate synthase [Candidatus Latescibacteria bacterium]|nr:dihydropteroate synthase [Candidatus Latescibacterota bacterium]